MRPTLGRVQKQTCEIAKIGFQCGMAWQQIIAVAGVAFLVVLAWRLGAFKTAHLTDSNAARSCFALDFPSLVPSRDVVAPNGRTALLDFGEAGIGAVFSVGDKFATRLWRGGALKNAIVDEAGTLTIITGDITCPSLSVEGLSKAELSAWQARLSRLCEKA